MNGRPVAGGTLAVLAGIVACLSARAAEPAADASFACRHAGRPDERLICGDPLLKAADAALGRQYAGLLAAVTDPVRREAIRADEHSWIVRRDQECGISSTTRLADADRPAHVDCFLAAYDERSNDLDRIAREPDKEPGSISTPIRRSLFADNPAGDAAISEVSTGLASADPDHAVFAWDADGGLAVLGRDEAKAVLGLYRWRDGSPLALVSDAVADPERIERICPSVPDLVLVPRLSAEQPLPIQLVGPHSVRLVAAARLDPEITQACGISSHRQLVAGGSGALDLGPADLHVAAVDDRYVMLRSGGASHRTEPAIRVDRRLQLAGQFLADTQSFVIGPAHRPGLAESALERKWAKTDCLRYWTVTAGDGAASPECIPYGDYVGGLPHALPTKSGVYFSVDGGGLYQVREGKVSRVAAGPIDDAVVSPDGCRIAFAGAAATDGRLKRGRRIAFYNICSIASPRTL